MPMVWNRRLRAVSAVGTDGGAVVGAGISRATTCGTDCDSTACTPGSPRDRNARAKVGAWVPCGHSRGAQEPYRPRRAESTYHRRAKLDFGHLVDKTRKGRYARLTPHCQERVSHV